MSGDPELPERARHRLRRLIETGPLPGVDPRSNLVDQLCGLAATELSLVGAAVTLMPTTGAHLVLGASNAAARRWEHVQFDTGEGPTADAARLRLPVLVGDLHGRDAGRWVGFESQVRRDEVAAVFAFPLLLGAASFGILTLYRGHPAALRPAELRTALVLVDLVVEVLLDTSLTGPVGGGGPSEVPTPLNRVLSRGLDDQAIVYQAQGMVMAQLGTTLVEALARMRARAYAQDLTLTELSDAVVDGTMTFSKGD